MPRKKSGEFDQIDYIKNFNKDTYINVSLRIRKDKKNIIDKLNSVSSKNSYIINLIEKDIKNQK